MAFQIWRLSSDASKFFYTKCRGRRKTITGFCLLVAPQKSLCSIKKKTTTTKNKNTLSKTQRDVSLLKKYLVSRSEPRELENIDTRDLDVSIANFLLQSKERRRTIIRAHIAEVCDVLRLNFCKCIFCSARPYSFFDDDLGCAARFAIAIKFSFGSTFCDFLLLICFTLRKLFQWKFSWYV